MPHSKERLVLSESCKRTFEVVVKVIHCRELLLNILLEIIVKASKNWSTTLIPFKFQEELDVPTKYYVKGEETNYPLRSSVITFKL